MRRVALAVAVHDPQAHFAPGLARVGRHLADLFVGVGALVTTSSADQVVAFLSDRVGARVAREPAGASHAGRHRRRSVELALGFEPDAVLYGDLDHVLRWIETDEDELKRCLESRADLTVVGRTRMAMEASPRRLRDTERIVNHIYQLMTGREWDLMFAFRLMSAAAARAIVEGCVEDTIANDVEWPLFAERRGFAVDYFPAAGLVYRTTEDFDAVADARDDDPALWISRVEIAARHAKALGRFLHPNGAE